MDECQRLTVNKPHVARVRLFALLSCCVFGVGWCEDRRGGLSGTRPRGDHQSPSPRPRPCPPKCLKWTDGCTECNCVDGHVEGCDDRVCAMTGKPKCLEWENPQSCPLGCLSWTDGCNVCTCVNGEVGDCEDHICVWEGRSKCLEYEPSNPCPPGCVTWTDGCAECACDNGTVGSCDDRVCIWKGRARCAEWGPDFSGRPIWKQPIFGRGKG